MQEVTYKGPEDPSDSTTRFRIDEHLLPVGQQVEVPNDVAEKLGNVEGHKFTIKPETGSTKEDK